MEKFTLITNLTQSGKTMQCIHKIETELNLDIREGRSLHIVFTINTLLNEIQFLSRLRNIATTHGKILIISSKNQVAKNDKKIFIHAKNIETAQQIINSNNIRIVIMCNNRTRISTYMDLIDYLDTAQVQIKRVLIYFDEIHKYIDSYRRIQSVREQIEILCHDYQIVEKIIGVTATPNAVFIEDSPNWGSIQQTLYLPVKLNNYTDISNAQHTIIQSPDYDIQAMLPDSKDLDCSVLYTKYVMTLHPEVLNEPRARVFAPALFTKKSHFALRKVVFDQKWNAVVIVLNSTEKTLSYFENEYDLIDKENTMVKVTLIGGQYSTKEVSDVISQIIQDSNLIDRPIVFTGLYCVGVGQTLTNVGFGTFTSAIISDSSVDSNDAVYQLIGRCTGQNKHWDTFKLTNIYTTQNILEVALGMEYAAREMTKLNGEYVTYQQYQDYIEAGGAADISLEKPKKKSKTHPMKSV
tara:strand:- start:3652 stop:5049 length:1398 start_codon:yes stop_codon:yes gene_type:complete